MWNLPSSAFLVVVEREGDSYSAYLPDIPGCVATGSSFEQAVANVRRSFDVFMATVSPGSRRDIQPRAKPSYIPFG